MNFVVITFSTECVHNAADRIKLRSAAERLDGISPPQAFNVRLARTLTVIRAGRSES